jgi:hypothetical protein
VERFASIRTAYGRINPVLRWVVGVIIGVSAVTAVVLWLTDELGHGGYSREVHPKGTQEVKYFVYSSTRPYVAAIVVCVLVIVVLATAHMVKGEKSGNHPAPAEPERLQGLFQDTMDADPTLSELELTSDGATTTIKGARAQSGEQRTVEVIEPQGLSIARDDQESHPEPGES